MAVSDTLIGNVFDGRYRIERKLGTGGMADVYLAEDQELGRRVAIKILNDRHAAVDQTSDLYSVGVVLYELLTGQVPFTGETPLEIAMKHLSEVPKPPSELRPEVPHDLDLVVLRALAKDPADRYQTAEEMDADLERVLRGMPVGAETAEAATAVLSGSGVIAAAPTSVITRPTQVAPARPAPPGATPPAGYYGYEGPPRRRRPVWPWVLAVLLLAAAGAAAWFAYTKIQDQLNQNKPVSVPPVAGLKESLAVQKLREHNLVPHVVRTESEDVQKGYVISQSP